MAGAGAKLFTSGSVLTASDVNTYLMDQTIMKFTSTTTRDAAFGGAGEPTLAEGMFAYTTDTDTLWFYTGSAWEVAALKPSTAQTSNRNKIINGAFDVWQRGTSYTVVRGNYGAADRYVYWHNGSTDGTNTVSQQTFTPGAAPVAGYESQFFQRITTTTLGTSQTVIDTWQRIEDVRTLAGQAVTVSFWAKTSGTFTVTSQLGQNFGSGGSASVDTTFSSGVTTSGSWTRYSATATVPSISGKTIGSGNFLNLIIRFNNPTAGATFDIWGLQVEAGSVATPFETEAIGTTLTKCQRYYFRANAALGNGVYYMFGIGQGDTTTNVEAYLVLPVQMRIAPTSMETTATASNYAIYSGGVVTGCTSLPIAGGSNSTPLTQGVSFRSTGAVTVGRAYQVIANANNTAYLGFSAEL